MIDLGQRHDAAAADALQAAAEDQHQHAGRSRARSRTRHEHAERDQHHAAAAVDIAELAIERRHHGRGQQIGDHHPGQILEIVERAADGRQRRRHDGLVERAEKHRQRQAADDADDLAPAELALGLPAAPTPRLPRRCPAWARGLAFWRCMIDSCAARRWNLPAPLRSRRPTQGIRSRAAMPRRYSAASGRGLVRPARGGPCSGCSSTASRQTKRNAETDGSGDEDPVKRRRQIAVPRRQLLEGMPGRRCFRRAGWRRRPRPRWRRRASEKNSACRWRCRADAA